MNGIIEKLVLRSVAFFQRDSKRALILILVPSLFLFSVLLYQVGVVIPRAQAPVPRASEFDLRKYINGYQNPQQEFTVENLRFGEKFLHFTLDLHQKPKTEFLIRKTVMEIVNGLTIEYPSLEEIDLRVIRRTSAGALTMYGRAVYDRERGTTQWVFQ